MQVDCQVRSSSHRRHTTEENSPLLLPSLPPSLLSFFPSFPISLLPSFSPSLFRPFLFPAFSLFLFSSFSPSLFRSFPFSRLPAFPPSLFPTFLPSFLSILLSMFFSYKEGFESLKQAKSNSDDGNEEILDGFESIGQFNQYILDISDSLWRNKAFVDRTKSLCYSIPR